MALIQSHKDLFVWQKSVELILSIYKTTQQFPPEERYGLTSQMRRASISIASNIAEGRYRGTRKDYVNFLRMALGSAAEIETQTHITRQLSWVRGKDLDAIDTLTQQIIKMLKVMIRKLETKPEANSQKLKAS